MTTLATNFIEEYAIQHITESYSDNVT